MPLDKTVTWRPVPVTDLHLEGTRAAVIGGTGGLGRAIARELAARGARVVVVGQTFRDEGVAGLEFVRADLSSMAEARRVGQELPAEELDLVVFTTGIFAAPRREVTAEGVERDMAVSYLSRLVLLRELAPRLRERRPGHKARVFVMGYPGSGQAGTLGDLNAERSYSAMTVHMNTVAGNEMLVLDAVRRHPGALFFGLNPGLVKTNIRDNFLGKGSLTSRLAEWTIGLFNPTPEAYARTITPLLVSPELEGHNGAMFDQKARALTPTAQLRDAAHVAAFLAESEALVAAKAGLRAA